MNKLAIASLISIVSATQYKSQDGGPTWEIKYDSENKKYNFAAQVTVGTDLWLAFSSDCTKTDCDIVQFLTTGAGSIKDAYGKLTSPRTDFINDYKSPTVTKSADGKTMDFTATRAPAPTDVIGKDVAFECGKEQTFTWVIKASGDTGSWTFKLNDDCTVWEAPKEEPKDESNTEEEKTGAMTLAATTVAAVSVMASLF